ncbi:hypothetical protein [Bacillus rubiinfantis]|nr:hypothetical protein [Bacillus rubiinfantis]
MGLAVKAGVLAHAVGGYVDGPGEAVQSPESIGWHKGIMVHVRRE